MHPELFARRVEHPLYSQGVGEGHHGALRAALEKASGDLGQLVTVSATDGRLHYRLRARSLAVQHDFARVMESGEDIDPALGAEYARLAGSVM